MTHARRCNAMQVCHFCFYWYGILLRLNIRIVGKLMSIRVNDMVREQEGMLTTLQAVFINLGIKYRRLGVWRYG